MSHQSNSSRDLFIGLAAGGALGAFAVFLLNSEKGKGLFRTLSQDVQQGAREFNGAPRRPREAEDGEAGDNKLLWRGVAGSLIGALSSLLLTPRTTRKLRQYLADSFEQVSDRTIEMVNSINEKGQEAVEVVTQQGIEWAERALQLADGVNREVDAWSDVVRAAAERAKEVAADAEDDAVKQQMREIMEWSDKALDVTERVTSEVRAWSVSLRRAVQRAEHHGAKLHKKGSRSQQQVVSDIMEWAAMGVNLWQNMRNQKRH